MNLSPIFCDQCGATNQPRAKFCRACGHSLQAFVGVSATGTLAPNYLLNGRYRIQYQIGRGGMGAVYRAIDIRLGDRAVAIKEMIESGMSQQEIGEAADAFRREAHLLAGLHHPNLPSIYDHFSENNRWYLIMEFIEGKTLEDHLQEAGGKLSIDEAINIAMQLCAVLDYLHNQKPAIIFRDLKPTNIMLSSDEHIYLIDFGIARHFKLGQTKDTVAYGSVGFAPPEQYGKAQTTPRSDIYSLGATLSYLLSGINPRDNPFTFAPLRLQGHPAASSLSTLVGQMVEMDPNRRPESVLAVKQELQQMVAGSNQTPIRKSKTSMPVRKKKSPHTIGELVSTYDGHAGHAINAVAWSPDSTKVASGSDDGTVDVWDADDGFLCVSYAGHNNQAVNGVAWSPDGTQIVSSSDDASVDIWDVSDGAGLTYYSEHESPVLAVVWSPDGTQIVSSSDNGAVDVWDVKDAECSASYDGHGDVAVNSLAWSPDSTEVVSGGDDGTADVWDATDGQRRDFYNEHTAAVNAVAWSSDGTRIVSASADGSVDIWNSSDTDCLTSYSGHDGPVFAVAWSPDSSRIASGGGDRTVQVWDADDGTLFFTYKAHNDVVTAIAWSPDGSYIVSGSADGNLHVWHTG